jgi:hypothetical protein
MKNQIFFIEVYKSLQTNKIYVSSIREIEYLKNTLLITKLSFGKTVAIFKIKYK